MIRPLLPPGMRPASMNSTSPPTGVQASPTATPGRRVRSATSSSGAETRRAEIGPHGLQRDFNLSEPPSAMRRACLRQIVPISRSRLRTPASRV